MSCLICGSPLYRDRELGNCCDDCGTVESELADG